MRPQTVGARFAQERPLPAPLPVEQFAKDFGGSRRALGGVKPLPPPEIADQVRL
ncbi:hypothetical protein [Nonomuraea recticatena]|uniref:Uncharacterized protein n=1 Tax=Nonomuraea recticatena TaxID=46178 RepID=A0ABP6FN23_9ACTN